MVIGRTVVCGPILALALVACGGHGTPSDPALQPAAIRGTVTYRERFALSPSAVVVVQLQDISRVDAPGIVVGEQRMDSPGQVPIRFEVRYDPAWIDPQRAYAISARLLQNDRLLFINDTAYYVITRGNPSRVEIVLRPVP